MIHLPRTLFRVALSLLLISPLPRLTLSLFAQSVQPAKKSSFQSSVDVSVGASGQLTFARTPMTADVFASGPFVAETQKVQSTSRSAGVQATFHQSFKPLLGYNVNLGYTRFTQSYSEAAGFRNPSTTGVGTVSYSQGSLRTNEYEVTIAYVVEGPGQNRLRTFSQVGGGGLFFVPIDAPQASQQTRPALVFGVGMEYRLSRHLGVRTEYRGLFYKGPDFAIDTYGFPKQRLFTVTNMPTVSMVYRFK